MAVFIAAAVCCVLLYFFFMMPSFRYRGAKTLCGKRYYAHRGLHGKGVCENSMEAFCLAMENGYGIELDVRLTKDDRLIVFHDDTTERLCGEKRHVREMDFAQIEMLSLPDGQKIPLFSQVLSMVQGKVPLMVEIKSHRMGDARVAEKTWEELKGYRGEYVVQSFDPIQLRFFRRRAKQVVRGQLARRCPEGKGFSVSVLVQMMAGNLMFNRLSVPDYVAYQHTDTQKCCYQMMRNVYKAPLAVWTVGSVAEEEKVKDISDVIIFENYLPGNDGRGEEKQRYA